MSYMDDNRYWQRWTITINGRTEEAVRKAMEKVTSNSFNLLRMDDIYSTSTASTKIEDRKEGDKMGDWGAVHYKADTIYKAVANTNTACCRIYFKFCQNVSRKMVWVAQSTDGILSRTYYIDTATEVYHVTNEGTWKMSLHKGCNPTWKFVQNDGYKCTPTISLATITQYHLKPKYMKDDMVDAAIYGIDLQTAGRRRQGVITSIKEVKGKMELQLFDVIFFNRKTKHIDYRENVVARDAEEAYMVAAQDFGKYDGKVHIRRASCVLTFTELKD